MAVPTPPEALPLTAMDRALRRTTETLAAELAHPGTAAPDWSETEWRIARAAAAIHGVSGLLARGLCWQGPSGWTAFLQDQHRQIALRLPRIQQLLQQIDAQARARGIALVALKGAALHAQGIYAAGERPMTDVDLLVAGPQTDAAAELITGLGFSAGPVTWKHRAFHPREAAPVTTRLGEDSTNPIKIELHSRVHEILPLRAVDVSALVMPPEARAGLNNYASSTGLLLHIMLHAAGSMTDHSLRLLHLNDIARLTQVMQPADWEELFRTAGGGADSRLWWAYPPLLLTQRYYGCVPGPVLQRLRAACQWTLRRAYRARTLSEVSLSYLWVSAFPGIAWSRSLAEMAAYVRGRLRPSPETLALRGAFAESQPLASGGEWAHTPQHRRVLRWLLARQPRQECLGPVRAALACASP
jgi:hypothetical protein